MVDINIDFEKAIEIYKINDLNDTEKKLYLISVY